MCNNINNNVKMKICENNNVIICNNINEMIIVIMWK